MMTKVNIKDEVHSLVCSDNALVKVRATFNTQINELRLKRASPQSEKHSHVCLLVVYDI